MRLRLKTKITLIITLLVLTVVELTVMPEPENATVAPETKLLPVSVTV